VSLLADAVVLLRALALLSTPRHRELLAELAPRQTCWSLASRGARGENFQKRQMQNWRIA